MKKKRRLNIRHLAIVLLVVISAVILLCTPMLNNLANASRPEPGYGGECLMWMFPLSGIMFLEWNEEVKA